MTVTPEWAHHGISLSGRGWRRSANDATQDRTTDIWATGVAPRRNPDHPETETPERRRAVDTVSWRRACFWPTLCGPGTRLDLHRRHFHHRVTDRDIAEAVAKGANDLGDGQRVTGAATGCGSCKKTAGVIVGQCLASKLGYAA